MGEPSKEALKAARERFNLLGIKDYAESAAWGLAHHFDRFAEHRRPTASSVVKADLFKRFLHDVVVHPLLFFTKNTNWVIRWHDRLADELEHIK